MNNKEKEILKESLLNYERNNEATWRGINCCIFMEQVTNRSDKEKALSKLEECTNHTKTIAHLCNKLMAELEKSTTDFVCVKIYSKKIEHTNSQLNLLIEDYRSLRKKPVEKED